MMAPIEAILNSMAIIGQAELALQKIDQLTRNLAAHIETFPGSADERLYSSWRAIKLEDVVYRYSGEGARDEFAVGPIRMVIRRGETLFISGGNGSGKTTLAKLILGLYRAESGELRVDGTVIGPELVPAYRELFSAVFSDCCVHEAMCAHHGVHRDQDIRGHLVQLGLNEKVTVAGGVLSTVSLSQGQKRRLALLGSLLEKRSLYLFDEWTADQDPEFRTWFYHHLIPELTTAGSSVVVITHDERYFRSADTLITMERGKVVRVSHPGRNGISVRDSENDLRLMAAPQG